MTLGLINAVTVHNFFSFHGQREGFSSDSGRMSLSSNSYNIYEIAADLPLLRDRKDDTRNEWS